MKLGVFLLVFSSSILGSLSAFAEDLVGLNCRTDYVIHDVRRTPYETSRVIIRESLLGGRSILEYIPVNVYKMDLREAFSLTDNNESIIYSLEVQDETTFLSIKVKTHENEITLLRDYQFKTKEGFARVIPLLDMVKLGEIRATNVVLTCLPAYR
jgi:hypothetical protein